MIRSAKDQHNRIAAHPLRRKLVLLASFATLFSLTLSLHLFAAPLYQPGDTLDPACAPGDPECTVSVLPDFPFSITNGGTGASSAEEARANLGLAYATDGEINEGKSVRDIAAWGDSLTAAGVYTAKLSTLTGRDVYNGGVGGENSTNIKTRMLADVERYMNSVIIWSGRNNYSAKSTVLADIAQMVDALGHDRYLVLSVLNGSGEGVGTAAYTQITELNAELESIYQERYVDVREMLVSEYDPSLPQDVLDHGDDIVPDSLRTDSIHLSTTGYQMVGEYIYDNYSNFLLGDTLDNQKILTLSQALGLFDRKSISSGRIAYGGNDGILTENSQFHFDEDSRRLALGSSSSPTHQVTLGPSNGIALYNTSDWETNYERLVIERLNNQFNIKSQAGGTGTVRSISLVASTGAPVFLTLDPSGGVSGFIRMGRSSLSAGTLAVGVASGTTFTGSSGSPRGLGILPTINLSGSAGYQALYISPYEQNIGTGNNYLIDAGVNSAASNGGTHTSRFTVSSSGSGYFADNLGVGGSGYFADNLGVGTTNPGARLQVAGSAIIGVGTTAVGTNSLTLRGDSASAGAEIFSINFQRSNYDPTGTAAAITFARASGGAEGELLFKTRAGTGSLEERLRITWGGNVGIGTGSTVSARLHAISSTEQLRLGYNTTQYWSDTIASDGGRTIAGFGTDADLNIAFGGATDGDFSVNTDDLFVDTSTGRVGIGTSAPESVLHMRNTEASETVLRIQGNYGNQEKRIDFVSNSTDSLQSSFASIRTYGREGGGPEPYMAFDLSDGSGAGTTPIERMRITSAGLIGIGDTTPDGKLDVEYTGAVTATNYGINLSNLTTNTTTDAIDKYGLYITSTGSFTGSTGTATNNYGLYVDTPTGGDNNYAAIFEGGNVGIGTATPTSLLHVSGTLPTYSAYPVDVNVNLTAVNPGGIDLRPTLTQTLNAGTVAGIISRPTVTVNATASIVSAIRSYGYSITNNGTVGIATGLYVDEPALSGTAATWKGALYVSSGQSYFAGNIGVGTSTPSAKFHSIATTEQLRLGYDASNYLSATVGSTGSATFALTGTNPTFSFSNAVRADSGIGIGTDASSADPLTYMSSTNGDRRVSFRNTSTGTAAIMSLNIGNTAGAGDLNIDTFGTGYTTSGLLIQDGSRITTGTGLSGGLVVGTEAAAPLIFAANNAEAARFSSAGYFGIAQDTPGTFLHVGNSSTTDGTIFRLQDSDGTCDYDPESGSVTVSCSSDERLKENIRDATSTLSYIQNILIHDYEVKASGDTTTGVIAQELIQTHPELVTLGDDQLYKVRELGSWTLVKGLQELDLKIEGIENLEDETFLEKLIAWFGDAGNGIAEFVAGIIRAERVETERLQVQELCVDEETCITAEQLRELLQDYGGSPSAPASSGPAADAGGDAADPEDPAPADMPDGVPDADAGDSLPDDPASDLPSDGTPAGTEEDLALDAADGDAHQETSPSGSEPAVPVDIAEPDMPPAEEQSSASETGEAAE